MSSIVWSVTPEDAERLKQLEPEQFNRELAMAFDMRLGACSLESERLTFPRPAAMRAASPRTAWRWWAMRRIPCIRWPGRA